MSGTHEHAVDHHEVKISSERSFGWVFTVVFVLIGLYPLLGEAPAVREWALAVAALLALVTLVRPSLLGPANRMWARFGLLLHRIVNPLIMGFIFYVVVTPIGLLLRLFGKDVLSLRFDSEASSYWVKRTPPGPEPDSLRNQF